MQGSESMLKVRNAHSYVCRNRYCLPGKANLLFALAKSLLLACLFQCAVGCTENERHLQLPEPNSEFRLQGTFFGGDLAAVIALPDQSNTMIAVGESGTILRSTDAGQHWTSVTSGTDKDLSAVVAMPDQPHTLMAVGESGSIVRSIDGGNTWISVASGTDKSLYAMLVLLGQSSTVIAVGESGTIVRSTDAGEHWTPITSGTLRDLRAVLALPGQPNKVIAVGESGIIVRSTDAGEHWTPVISGANRSLSAIVAVSGQPNTVIAVGESGIIVRSIDAGEHWTPTTSKTIRDLKAVLVVQGEPHTVIAVGWGGTIIRSTDAGERWMKVASGTESVLSDVLTVPGQPTTIVAVGSSGVIVLSTDAGEHWKNVTSGTGERLLAMLTLPGPPSTVIAVGSSGAIVRSADAGERWTPITSWTSNSLINVLAIPGQPNTLIAVGHDGAIFRSADSGERWSEVASGTESDLRDVLAVSGHPDMLVAVGMGAIVRSTDAGETWAPVTDGTEQNLEAVIALPGHPDMLVAVGWSGTIVRSTDAGERWTPITSGTNEHLNAVIPLPDQPDKVIAVGDSGAIVRTDDAGERWTPITSGTLRDLRAVLALPGHPDTLIAVGEFGAIVRSTDAGETWTPVTDGTDQDLKEVIALPGHLNTLIAVGDSGAIVRSTDAGETWTHVISGTNQRLHAVLALHDQPDTLIAVGEFGAIVRSANAGQRWMPVASGTVRDLFALLSTLDQPHTVIAAGQYGAIVRLVAKQEVPKLREITTSYDFSAQRNPMVRLRFEGLNPNCQSEPCISVRGLGGRLLDNTQQKKTFEDLFSVPPESIVASGDGRYEIPLKPNTFSVAPGEPIHIRIRLTLPGYELDYPGTSDFYEIPNHPAPIPIWVWSFAAALILSLTFYLLTLFRPLAFLRLANSPAVWEAASAAKVPFVGAFITLMMERFLLPVLMRQTHVIDAWIKHHQPNIHKLFGLQVASTAGKLKEYSALPFKNELGEKKTPTPEEIASLFVDKRNCIRIVGQGGAGKTRLAIQIGQWLFNGEITPYPAVAVFIDEEFDDLLSVTCSALKVAIDEKTISRSFVDGLLKRGRIWLIVDRLSERSEKTQEAFKRLYEQATPRVVICTARHAIAVKHVSSVQISPLPLDHHSLLSFLGDQLQAEQATALFPTLKDQGALFGKLTQLLTLGGKELPVTPLLVRVFVSQAIALGKANGVNGIAQISESIPDIYFNYIKQLDHARRGDSNGQYQSSKMRWDELACRAAVVLAFTELAEDFRPKPVQRRRVLEALKVEPELKDLSEEYLGRMIDSGLVSQREFGAEPFVEFVLDPIAECLAAYAHAKRCGSDADAWRSLVSRIADARAEDGGFMLALRLNHAAYGHVFGFPAVQFPEQFAEAESRIVN